MAKYDLEKKYEAEAFVEFLKDFGYNPKRRGASVSFDEGDEKTANDIFNKFKELVLCSM